MIVYRITLPKYANDLSGTGSALFGGRWNSIGNSVLYTAENSSLSMLEHLVHIHGAQSIQYVLSIIEVNSSIKSIEDLDFKLKENWESNEKYTASIGDEWVRKRTSTALLVPSAINPLEHNLIINTNHPEIEMTVLNQEWFVYDRRLMKS